MSNKKILCIFPEDATLAFLDHLKEYLEKHFDSIRITPNQDSHDKALEKIKALPENSTIIFIGHGSSHCFYGACNAGFERKSYINNSNFHIFKNKEIFALSCRSSEFLETNKATLKNYIGFGNLPTDWKEIESERNYGDSQYLNNLSETDINYYKEALTSIILSCFLKLDDFYDFKIFYFKLKLHINKEIANLIIEKKNKNYRAIANLWYDTKLEMDINSFQKTL